MIVSFLCGDSIGQAAFLCLIAQSTEKQEEPVVVLEYVYDVLVPPFSFGGSVCRLLLVSVFSKQMCLENPWLQVLTCN